MTLALSLLVGCAVAAALIRVAIARGLATDDGYDPHDGSLP